MEWTAELAANGIKLEGKDRPGGPHFVRLIDSAQSQDYASAAGAKLAWTCREYVPIVWKTPAPNAPGSKYWQ